MTLSQINSTLPNGFHDAEISRFEWNFLAATAAFEMDFWVATDEGNREKRRIGTLELTGVVFISVEPPDPRQLDPKPFVARQEAIQIDAMPANAEIFPALPRLTPDLAPGTEVFSFYVSNWNSFIHIACGDARIQWAEE
jgi:hypothetical protein